MCASRSSCDVLSHERSLLEAELSQCREERGAMESQVLSETHVVITKYGMRLLYVFGFAGGISERQV